MPRAPNENLVRLSEDEVERLSRLHAEAEREILDEVNRALLKGNKLDYLKSMLDNVQVIICDLQNGSRTWCEQAIPQIYMAGTEFADDQARAIGAKVTTGFGAVHQQAAQVLAEASFNRFEDLGATIGRRVDDIYRTLALENIRGSVIGYSTWQRVVKGFREQLAERGVTGFKDAVGRQWNMKTYAEMVARTTTMEAHLHGTSNRLTEHGYDLVKVSTHIGACEKCGPWQGRTLSLTGKTQGYPTLQEAKAAGLFHPNCRHAYGLSATLDSDSNRPVVDGPDISQAGEKPKYYMEVPDLPEEARIGLAEAFREAIEFGHLNGRECLLHIDAKTGKKVYSRLGGEERSVELTPELLNFLHEAEKDSLISIHNHPSSGSFSPEDLNILARFKSIKYIAVIGHDGTKYYMRCDSNLRPPWLSIKRTWETLKDRYYYQWISGRISGDLSWKDHSHKISEGFAEIFGWVYGRVLPYD